MLPSTAEVPPGVVGAVGTGVGAAATNLFGMKNLPTGVASAAGQNNAASTVNGARSASSSFISQSQGGVVADVQPGVGATVAGPFGGSNGVSYLLLRDPTSSGSYAAFAAAAATLNESSVGATQAQPMGGTVGTVGTTTSVGTNNINTGIFCRRLPVGILDLFNYIYYNTIHDPRTRCCTKIDSDVVHEDQRHYFSRCPANRRHQRRGGSPVRGRSDRRGQRCSRRRQARVRRRQERQRMRGGPRCTGVRVISDRRS